MSTFVQYNHRLKTIKAIFHWSGAYMYIVRLELNRM